METSKANTILNQFNVTIDTWITYLDDYDLKMLCQKPHPDSWSLGQVYVHLIQATKYFVEQMNVALLNDTNLEKEMHENAKSMFDQNSFPNLLIEGPDNNTNVQQPKSKEELLHGLGSIKDKVNELYSTFDFQTSKGKTKHPGLLYFTAMEWLQLIEMHLRHHFRQKKRIDESLLK